LDLESDKRSELAKRVTDRDALIGRRAKDLYERMEAAASQRYTLRRSDGARIDGKPYPRKDRQFSGFLLGTIMVPGGSDQWGGLRPNVQRSEFLGEDGAAYYTDRAVAKRKVVVYGPNKADAKTIGVLDLLARFGLAEGI
jgi:hypothetical protein